jgi:hypothetical protein
VAKQTRIEDIEKFFKENDYPKEEFELSPGVRVIDPEKFVNSHLSFLKANPGNKAYRPYYDHLHKFYIACTNQKKRTSR